MMEIKCSDSDSGIDTAKKGTTMWKYEGLTPNEMPKESTVTDYCESGDSLIEAYCGTSPETADATCKTSFSSYSNVPSDVMNGIMTRCAEWGKNNKISKKSVLCKCADGACVTAQLPTQTQCGTLGQDCDEQECCHPQYVCGSRGECIAAS